MKAKVVKDDLVYIVFTEIYHRFDDAGAKRKAFLLLEAAIDCYAKKGFDSATLDMIARHAGVTRPLLNHYFGTAGELRDFAMKYIRILFQKLAIEKLQAGKSPRDALREYVDSCFYWQKNFPNHTFTWVAFLLSACKQKTDREVNSKAQEAGAERIIALLNSGKEAGQFQFADAAAAAKLIQALIAGAILIVSSENLDDPRTFLDSVILQCLTVAGASSPA